MIRIRAASFLGGLVVCLGSRSRVTGGCTRAGMPLGFVATIQGAWGGTVFVFSNQAIYDPYLSTTQPWGLEPVEDINLGGAIMLGAGLIFLLTVVALIVGVLTSMDEQDEEPTTTPAVIGGP